MAAKCPKCDFDNTADSKFCKECGTQLPPPQDHTPVMTETLQTPARELTTGSTFAGRYQVIEELGHGGMGRVYRAMDLKLNEEVALKLIKPEIALDKKNLERFQNELKLARKIGHRNVGKMYELMEEKRLHFITMEYVPGQDLRGLIRQSKQLTIGTAVAIAKEVCEGLAEAHRLGIIHRDLKPSNIIIDKEGNAKIMDFGIARSLKGKGITGAGVMIGTPEYMSPEQVEGKEVDQLSDIYSLGVILYEMVTGRVPFEGDTPFTIGVKHKSEIPRNPKELNTQIPEDLSKLILRCMEKDKAKRYQSAEELITELTRIEKGIPTTEHATPKRKPFTSKQITVTFGAKKLLIPALGIIVVVLAALAIWRFLPKKQYVPLPSGKPSIAILYFENISGDKNLDAWKTGLSELLITKLSQSKFINVLDGSTIYSILKKLNLDEAKRYTKEDLLKVANEGRATHTISGSIMKAEQNIIITLTLQRPYAGEVISSIPVECNGEKEIMSKVDEVARKIKSDLSLLPEQIANDIDKDVGKITTSSPEAYKYYIEGIQHDVKGEYRQVIESMEKAVAIDPKFASAYLAMSWSYSNLVYFAEEKKCLEKALALSDRLTDREKLNIQGNYFSGSEKTYDKAVEALEKLLALYPDDILGGNMLAILYSRMGENEKAIERYRVCIQAGTEDVVVYQNLAATYEQLGAYDKSIEVKESYLKNIGDSAVIRRSLALTYSELRKSDLALSELDKAAGLSPAAWENTRARGDIYLYMDNLSGAEEEYKKLLQRKEGEGRGWGLVRLINLYTLQARFGEAKKQAQIFIKLAEKLGQGRWARFCRLRLSNGERISGHPEAALPELDKAWTSAVADESFGDQRNILLSQGLTYLAMKSKGEAQDVAAKLKAAIDVAPNKKLFWYYHYLTGMIELEKKNYSKAIEFFKLAQPLLDADSATNLLFADALGTAFYQLGDLNSARQEYAKIVSLGIGRLDYGDIYSKSYYRLGKISEQQRRKAEAAEHYRKFLDLWKDADPGLPEVADTRQRLAGLTGG